MGAIDFRFRPVGTQSITRELTYEYLRKMKLNPAASFESQDIDLMFQEMEEADIEKAVIGVPAPTDKEGFVSTGNKKIAKYLKRYPKKFLGLASLDVSELKCCFDTIEYSVDNGFIGVTVEPSTSRSAARFNHKSFYPLYEELQRRDILLVTVMSALLGPYMDDCKPEWVDHVATDFPGLRIVIQHGAWPYSREAVGVCFKQPNVFLVPGQYLHYEFAGSDDYVIGANRQLGEQILFGSVYPNCGPLKEVMEIVNNLGFKNPVILKNYLGDNARRLLKIL
tara:strand:- start:413 stop:1252 length:840 start_codon:yes stop_codon:yes gene_type:complete